MINRQELQQVLINLIVNATQAMQEQGETGPARELDIAVRHEAGRVLLEVSDSGPGLSEAVRATLFQPFFTTRRDGNGLGLWISRGLLERYGGELRAANRPEGQGGARGAVFTIDLPAAEV
ncbi:MAG: ATP-binding protein [Sphaerotilus sulfidivorans]|uniref:ATP-binding protein n=1 Tax=Sphaerotilus sulfidivorans TaxID=639200 RepID=UPI003F3E8256